MPLSGFICHDDYLAKLAKLTDEEVGRLFRALMAYHATGEEKEITGREWLAFDFIREDIDRAEKAHEEKCRKNRENRLGAIEQQASTDDNERQRSSTDVNEGQRSTTYKDKDKDKDKEKDNDNKNRFVPPTLDEVTAYMKEIGCDVDPQYFLDYQEARNWVLSNGKKAKDWKAVIRTWKHNDFKRTNSNSGVKKVVAQTYTQRDYDGEQEDAFKRTIEQANKGQEGVDYGYEDIIMRRMIEDMKTG